VVRGLVQIDCGGDQSILPSSHTGGFLDSPSPASLSRRERRPASWDHFSVAVRMGLCLHQRHPRKTDWELAYWVPNPFFRRVGVSPSGFGSKGALS
jgi:hypothetical protein